MIIPIPLKEHKAPTLSEYSALLEYPNEGYCQLARQRQVSISADYPKAGRFLAEFCEQIEAMPLSELEEVFTRTFDMAPICSPYISAHIYGDENYERGNLMAGLIQRYDETGFDRGNEMPDHLAVMLRYIPLATCEEADELVEFCLKKPVAEMADNLKNASSNPYGKLFASLLEVMSASS